MPVCVNIFVCLCIACVFTHFIIVCIVYKLNVFVSSCLCVSIVCAG